MMKRRWSLACVLCCCFGCGSASPTSGVSREVRPVNSSGGQSRGRASNTNGGLGAPRVQSGASFEHPLETCGAMEGYTAISRFVCADGEMPLHGNPELGAGARLGSSRPHVEGTSIMDSHIVDIYRVPCASGPVEVFVCLYHCDGGRPRR